jgi:hypothetical protein
MQYKIKFDICTWFEVLTAVVTPCSLIVHTDVLEECTASIFRVKDSAKQAELEGSLMKVYQYFRGMY